MAHKLAEWDYFGPLLDHFVPFCSSSEHRESSYVDSTILIILILCKFYEPNIYRFASL